MEKPLLKVDSKIGVCVDTAEDEKYLGITEVIEEEKTIDFFYLYTLKITGMNSYVTVSTIAGGNVADINRIRLLDYDHAWEKSEVKDGEAEYVQYFFDNSNTTDASGNDIFDGASATGLEARKVYYSGQYSTPFVPGKMFQSIHYPVIDFFHDEFIHVIENKSMVWMRRKSGGGLDSLTWNGSSYAYRNPNKGDESTQNGEVTVIPDTNYVIKAAREKTQITETINSAQVVVDRTRVQRNSDIVMQPTMAKFVGWPHADVEVIGTGESQDMKISNATPFYFLKPDFDEASNSTQYWDDDDKDIYPKTTFYINGAHAVPDTDQNSTNATGANFVEGKFYRWCTHSPAMLKNSTNPCWTPNAQEVAGCGSKFIPGDGNEYYNVKFWRNDGDSFSPPVTLDSRQGLIFDTCEFLSIWDGYSVDYTGSTEISEALVIENDSYDNTFINCDFELKTVQKEVVYQHVMSNGGTGTNYCNVHEYLTDNHIFGKREKRVDGSELYEGGIVSHTSTGLPTGNQKIGFNQAVFVKDSGNIKFEGCSFKANYGQDCLVTSNADNLDVHGCKAETYYHNTEVLYSKHYVNNTSDYDVEVYNSAKVTYEGTLALYEVFVDMFGSEADIIAAYAARGSYWGNPYMNGEIAQFDWSTIDAANSSITSKKDAQEDFEAASNDMPFKISEKYELKPKGFWFKDQSSSVSVKGTKFYGEGIGFFVSDCTNSHYLEFENNRVDTYIDEAYLLRNVKYPKLRGCWGHTIAHSVFKFESCLKPVQYDCSAESDTGFGYEFVKGEPTSELTVPFATDMWRVYDCHVLSGSGLEYDPKSMPAKIDFGTFIQTANSTQDTYVLPESSGIERSLVGIKLYDAPYKAAFRNIYFKGIKNDIDIYKGDNVELYLENAHFAANREIHGTYSSPAYFIHKGFSGVWEYRDIGGSITTSAVYKEKNDSLIADTSAGFSLSFKSHIDNPLGRSTVVLGNSNDETQYLDLVQGTNKIEVYIMARLLDVEKPLTNQDIWLELRYKDRAPGDPHVTTATTRGDYSTIERIPFDEYHQSKWKIKQELVPNAYEYKLTLIVEAGQDCSCPLSICYEYFTTVGEIYVDPYARLVQLDEFGAELG
jgi:hypothetical protein